jgi:hypothetical protein
MGGWAKKSFVTEGKYIDPISNNGAVLWLARPNPTALLRLGQ